ncbi:hypothetical protein SLP22_0005 [Salmonella phage BAU.Micro_SLP-22]|nr:hypothetical protein SLP22_00070 [Salmonella phage BAU.Micro_SLP-22]
MSQPMTLEALILGLTAALEANTAALNAKGGSAADAGAEKTTGGKKTTTGGKKTTTEKVGPKHTKAEATAAVVALKDAAGAPAARELLASFGIDKVANIPEDKFDEVFDGATKALEAFNDGGNDEGEDDI